MAKRFTDTEKYKKPFYRGLKGPYKLLWDYLYHNCDNAGIWIVDFEVAQVYLGKDMPVNRAEALRLFNAGDIRIIEFSGGEKWFIPSFITFQYGELSNHNPAHKRIIPILKALDFIDDSLVLQSTFRVPIQGTMVEEEVMVEVKEKEKKGATKKQTEHQEIAARVIAHNNLAAGRNFDTNNREYVRLITKLLNMGHTESQMLDVVDMKAAEWMGTEFEKRVCPATLFAAENFNRYLDDVAFAKERNLTAAQIKNATKPGGKKLLDPMEVLSYMQQKAS